MMTNEQLAEAVARVKELDAKRTQGEWFWSARTLRSDIRDADGDVEETHDILWKDMCGIGASEANAEFLLSAPQMASIIAQQDAIIQQQRDVMRMARVESERIIALGLEPSELPDNIRVGRMFTISERIRAALDAALKGGE